MKKIVAFVLIFAMMFSFASCKNKMDASYSTVLILGKNEKTKFSPEKIDSLEDIIEKSFYKTGKYESKLKLEIIVPDKAPTFIEYPAELDLNATISASNGKTYRDRFEAKRNTLMNYLKSEFIKADDSEVDILAALTRAKNKLSEPDFVPENNTPLVIIYSSGFTTSGGLNMTKLDLVKMDADGILGSIPEEAFPHFPEGTKCMFIGLGNVGKGQDDISASNNDFSDKMVSVWKKILEEKCGLTMLSDISYSSFAGKSLGVDPGYTDYPAVSSIALASAEPIDINLQESKVPFLGDSDAFLPVDGETNEEARIRYILTETEALRIKACSDPETKIYIVGSICCPDNAPHYQTPAGEEEPLSRARAERIKEILSSSTIRYKELVGNSSEDVKSCYTGEEYPEKNEYPVPEKQIIVINGGLTDFSWREGHLECEGIDDINSDAGRALYSSRQKLNRTVAITYKYGDITGEYYKELQEKNFIKD